MTEEQLLAHAARCSRLAEVCSDESVARKLRALAQDYRRFAEQTPEKRARGSADAAQPLEPRRENAA